MSTVTAEEHLPQWIADLPSMREAGDNQWTACCPAHADKTPSLRVSLRDGKVAMHCFAGCTIDAICDAVSRTVSDLDLSRADQPSGPGPQVLASYVYRSADGAALYRINRLDRTSHRFITEHLAPDGRWVKSRGGHPPMLYRLPELLAADLTKDVWCTEGEKDADAVRSLGITATTVPSNAWTSADLSALRGRSVAVICDGDKAGISHGRKRVTALREAGAVVDEEMVLYPEVPGCAKPDFSDALAWCKEVHGEDYPHLLGAVITTLREVSGWGGDRSLDERMTGYFTTVPYGVTQHGPVAEQTYIRLGLLAAGSDEAHATITDITDHISEGRPRGLGRNAVADAMSRLQDAGLVEEISRGKYRLPYNSSRKRRIP